MRAGQILSAAFTVIVFALCSSAEAQQPKKNSRIGFLGSGSALTQKALTDSFRQGLNELGYIEGQNIDIVYRYAEARDERFAELAAELIRLRLDVIVTISTRATIAVKQATTAIPIVAANAGDLLGAGVVTSLAHPGGNVTGTTNTDPDFSAKRLALLKESFPELSHVAVLYNGGPGGDDEELKETQAQARNLKIQVQAFEIKDPNQFAEAYAAMKREHATALIIFRSGFTKFHLIQLLELATKNRLPTMCGEPGWADAGCLISYGADLSHQLRRAALFVDKIIKGAKPSDLPVEQPMKFDFVINLKTAKQIGLTIPPNVLARADKVIR